MMAYQPGTPSKAARRGLPAVAAAIKSWTRGALRLDESAAVSVNELSCALPDCPPSQTVILVLQSGSASRKVAIHKIMAEVTENDVREAWASLVSDKAG